MCHLLPPHSDLAHKNGVSTQERVHMANSGGSTSIRHRSYMEMLDLVDGDPISFAIWKTGLIMPTDVILSPFAYRSSLAYCG